VTGSCGKTTVKELIAAVLGSRFKTTRNPLSYNNDIGVPLSILAIDNDTQVAVIEIGTNAPGEIAALCAIARPNRALITNIGRAHLEGFGTCEAVAGEKSALVDAVGERGTFYVNIDDPFCLGIADRFPGRRVTYGTGNGATWRAVRIELSADAAKSTLDIQPLGSFTVPLVGAHNAVNALAAIAVGADFGLTREEIQQGLDTAKPPPMRMNPMIKKGRVFLNDAYNANPESMRAAIETLASHAGSNRTIAVFGDMLELGDVSLSEHRELGRLVARAGINVLIVLGEFAQDVVEGALDAGLDSDRVRVCKDHSEAARVLQSVSAAGDVVLVKGSRAMAMEKVLEAFDTLSV
jgi:UDP-N-acetylmuramoyl-tripeptide--D-alanyl-D-alanine ligase